MKIFYFTFLDLSLIKKMWEKQQTDVYKRQDIASIDEDLDKLKQEKLKVMSPKYKQKLKEIRKNLRKVDRCV